MLIAMRMSLVLVLSVIGVLASLTEVNASRFCRRASACPCVPVATCEPAVCLPVAVVNDVPLANVHAVHPVVYAATTNGPTISGKIWYGPVPKVLANTDIIIRVKLADDTLVGEAPQLTTGATGTFNLNQYTTPLPANGTEFWVEFKRYDSAATVFTKHGPYIWTSSTTTTFTMHPWVP